MPYYYDNKLPTTPWKGSSDTMNTSIILDQPANVSYTNLDQISGRLVLRTVKSLDIDTIVVKLEGESRSRLLSAAGPGEKQKPQLEYHKILYRVQLVFPPVEVLRNRQNMGMGKNTYTIPPGSHEYPFSFKIPFNNACGEHQQSQQPSISLTGSGLEFAKPPSQHVKKTLPPTLSGFPGEAEIRYFVKATVSRHYFFSSNPRVYQNFNFFPIEPPRPALTGSEVYARQKHSFTQSSNLDNAKSKVKGLFGKPKESTTATTSGDAPQVSIDARLPEPAILTCNEDIPLRLIVKKLNNCDAMLFLQSLEISLIGSTKIRAHDVYRTENNSWIIMSKSNLGIPLGAASDPVDTETVIDDRMWRGQALPSTVAPSFQTCNIERSYQLDVRVGLRYTSPTQDSSKPQTVILPLRLDIQVFSGIAPPKELLEAMAEARASIRRRSTVDKNSTPTGKLQTDPPKDSGYAIPPTPMEQAASSGASDLPAQQGSRMPHTAENYFDAPPSYEDAMATELPPPDAHRPAYQPPAAGDDKELRPDEKKGFLGRRDS